MGFEKSDDYKFGSFQTSTTKALTHPKQRKHFLELSSSEKKVSNGFKPVSELLHIF
jgi:hypothetical protein